MKITKNTGILLGVLVAAIAAFFLFNKWSRAANGTPGTSEPDIDTNNANPGTSEPTNHSWGPLFGGMWGSAEFTKWVTLKY